jgi:hypothetical protein
VFAIHLPSIPRDVLIARSALLARMWDYVTHNSPPAHHPFKICYYGSVVDKPQQTYQGSTLVTYIMTPITPPLLLPSTLGNPITPSLHYLCN